MPFTAQELSNIANQCLDLYMRDGILSQTIQDKPLLAKLKAGQKTFPGGKGNISGNVKGDYLTTFMGFTHDQTVTYGNPANVKQFNYPWKELHAGIQMTLTELKNDGISVIDSLNSEKTVEHSDREITAITNIFDDKLEDMSEGIARSHNLICWQDGTQSALVFPGILSFISDDPTTGVVAGIDRAVNTWWRNRSKVAANKITSSVSLQTLTKTLRSEVRQLRRYGGRPDMILCGSTFLDKLEAEVHEKGTYTQQGFVNNGKNDIGMAMISMRGVGDFAYDPTLDDLGRSDFAYFLDSRHIQLRVMDGEDMKQHAPARPPEKYVLYRAITWTGGLICRKMNAHGVYQTA